MTTLQKTALAVILIVLIAGAIYQATMASRLRRQVQTLEQQQQETKTALVQKTSELEKERERATNVVAMLAADESARKKSPTEVLKLRGEVGRLRQENAQLGSTNALSKATATPEARKMLRDVQKMGMKAIYRGFAERAKLTPEQSEKLGDLLADHIMDNVDHITTALRDKLSAEQVDAAFGALKAGLNQQIEELLGAETLGQYQDYTRNLLASISAEQFKQMLTGSETERQQKSSQLRQALQDSLQASLANSNLPADYQAVPMLNLANIASEQIAEQSLKLMDDVYQRAAASAAAFLSPEELEKFQEFRGAAMTNSRGALSMNRVMMAPISN